VVLVPAVVTGHKTQQWKFVQKKTDKYTVHTQSSRNDHDAAPKHSSNSYWRREQHSIFKMKSIRQPRAEGCIGYEYTQGVVWTTTCTQSNVDSQTALSISISKCVNRRGMNRDRRGIRISDHTDLTVTQIISYQIRSYG
jgi:hypothetical protein